LKVLRLGVVYLAVVYPRAGFWLVGIVPGLGMGFGFEFVGLAFQWQRGVEAGSGPVFQEQEHSLLYPWRCRVVVVGVEGDEAVLLGLEEALLSLGFDKLLLEDIPQAGTVRLSTQYKNLRSWCCSSLKKYVVESRVRTLSTLKTLDLLSLFLTLARRVTWWVPTG
jgi:hypothetical protein